MIVALLLLFLTAALVLTFAVSLCAGCLDDFKSGNTSSSSSVRPSDPKLKRASSSQFKLKRERKSNVGGKSDTGQVQVVHSKEGAKTVSGSNSLSRPSGVAKVNGPALKKTKTVSDFQATAYADNGGQGFVLVDSNQYERAVARAKAQRAKEQSTIDSGSLPMHSFPPGSQCDSSSVKSYQTESFRVKSKSVIGAHLAKCKETGKLSVNNPVPKVSDPKPKI